jgi:RNA polymerase sigma factor (sigma-70 family)
MTSRERLDFEEFYLSELPRLTALASALSGDTGAAGLARDVLLDARRRWSELTYGAHPEATVRRACAERAYARARGLLGRHRARGRARADLSEETAQFWVAVRRLPARQAQAVALRYLYDLGLTELAATLQCSQEQARDHLARARQALAADLVGAEGDRT